MRQKRAKSYRKQMNVYRMTFKFREPVQVLVDSDVILEAQKSKFDLQKGIDRTLQVKTKLLISQCCINHLYNSDNQAAIDIAKTMEKRRCQHKDTLPSDQCITSLTNVDGENKFRYVVVTQNKALRHELRKIPAVPMIYLNRSVMIMEPMSIATKRVVKAVERMKLTGGLNDVRHAGLKDKEEPKKNTDDEGKKQRTKKRGPKGPNPLSIKRKKSKSNKDEKNEEPAKKKRHRRHGKSKKPDNAIETKEEDNEKSQPSNNTD